MKKIKIISINCDDVKIKNEYALEEWKKDWWGKCNFCPANDDNIVFVSVDGKEVDLEKIADKNGDGQFPVYFEHVAQCFGF